MFNKSKYQKQYEKARWKRRKNNPDYKQYITWYLSIYQSLKTIELFEILGRFCNKCNEVDIRLLDVHHIKPDKWVLKRPTSNSGQSLHDYLYYYVKHPDLAKEYLQLLCVKCHRLETLNRLYQR